MQDELYVIVGLGMTGLSCANYLAKKQIPFAIMDTRSSPPNLNEFKKAYPHISLSLGKLDETILAKASTLVLSPGIPIQEPVIAKQIARGIPIVGDIELFALNAKKPTIAITGTNAKSTVTTLVGEMAKACQYKTEVGGNLGKPALDLLDTSETDLYVLELSSFQLETTYSLEANVATVLNVTPDHMDRYVDFEHYSRVKKHIYKNCQTAVCNRDDVYTECGNQFKKQKIYFTLNEPKDNEFGLCKKNKELFLAFEDQLILSVHDLPMMGRQFQANALAALAIGYGFGFDLTSMVKAIKEFKGLPHRCQWVRERNGVIWYNDSKGTNVGATLAAIEGLGSEEGKLILIAGGVGKNADFSPLILPIERYVKAVVLIGEASSALAEVIGDRVDVQLAKSMEEAIHIADRLAGKGDNVLLSPACASFDMFRNFEHRGQVFMEIVQGLK